MELELFQNLPEGNSSCLNLIFVHGSNHGAWCWKENFIPYFYSKGFPVYALSLRGHGKSEGREDINLFSLTQYTEDVLELMKKLKGEVILIGHSMGGAVVQRVLCSHPEKVKAAVLLSSIPNNGMLRDFLRLLITKFKISSQLGKFNKGEKVQFPLDLYFWNKLSSQKRELYSSLMQVESKRAVQSMLTNIVPKKLKVDIPMLIIGSKKDSIISEKSTISMAKFYHTKPIILNNIGHDIMLDSNWQVAAEVIYKFCISLQNKRMDERDG